MRSARFLPFLPIPCGPFRPTPSQLTPLLAQPFLPLLSFALPSGPGHDFPAAPFRASHVLSNRFQPIRSSAVLASPGRAHPGASPPVLSCHCRPVPSGPVPASPNPIASCQSAPFPGTPLQSGPVLWPPVPAVPFLPLQYSPRLWAAIRSRPFHTDPLTSYRLLPFLRSVVLDRLLHAVTQLAQRASVELRRLGNLDRAGHATDNCAQLVAHTGASPG